jgi:hypothetical protein
MARKSRLWTVKTPFATLERRLLCVTCVSAREANPPPPSGRERIEINSIALAIDTGLVLAGAAKVHHQTGYGRAAAHALQSAARLYDSAEVRLRDLPAPFAHVERLRGRLLDLQQKLREFPLAVDGAGTPDGAGS